MRQRAPGTLNMERPATQHNAFQYALRELGRRAGVPQALLSRWKTVFDADGVTLYPAADGESRIVFPCDFSKLDRFAVLRAAPAVRYEWMETSDPALRCRVPDFVVLFDDRHCGGTPLFKRTGDRTFECAGDILTSSLWTLGRFEELHPESNDEHGRFPAASSAAYKAGCIDRPIVDEYGLALQDVLSHLLPGWTPERRDFRVKLSHDIDLTGVPFNLRTAAGHVYPRRIPGAFFRDVLALARLSQPAYLGGIVRTAKISKDRGLHSAFYWQTAAPSPWDAGYDIETPRIRAIVETLAEDFEAGIHPGYYTFGSPQRLFEEVARLRRVIGGVPIGGRQHYLRWSPSTWKAWEDAGLAYDSTVGFADAMGFRAGTCIPYRPWLFEENRESRILEIPLVVMDCTPVRYMMLNDHETLSAVRALIERCKAVGGVFTLLWHNASVIERPYAALYPQILEMLTPAENYDWRTEPAPTAAAPAMEATP